MGDVAKPTLYWVEGRCYRKNPSRNNYGIQSEVGAICGSTSASMATSISAAPYREYDDITGCDPDGVCDEHDGDGAEYIIEEVNGGFKTRCDIPDSLYGTIIGPKGATKKRLEIESNTKILIPRFGEKGHISVRGSKREDVVKARLRIELVASQARFRREATHFLCFPLNSPNIIQSVREFREKVLSDSKGQDLGIDEKIFQDPGKIHFTLCVLILLDQDERKTAADVLDTLQPEIRKIASKGNLRLRLRGLEIMNDDPTQVNILFAKAIFAENDTTVQTLADLIYQNFLKTNYGKSSRSTSVKLHATLMNTRYRYEEMDRNEPGNGNRGFNKSNKETFNAKQVLEKYGDYDFGFIEIKEVHISTRHSKGPDGFYKASAKISLKDD